jgi:hypothetical protein
VPRFVHRRAIVFFVLLCQLLAVGVVHVPMAKAAPVPATADASGHCHDSAPAAADPGDDGVGAMVAGMAMDSTSGADESGAHSGHHCKAGFCACVCAHAPAGMAATLVTPSPQASRPPLLVMDHVYSAPERATVFFRPPI